MKKLFSNKNFSVGFAIILIFCILGIFANYIAPHDPDAVLVGPRLSTPSSGFLLGTDEFGRDILSRLIFGARTTLMIILPGVFIACILGVLLGLISGFYSKFLSTLIMRFVDGLMSFPAILLAIVVISVLERGPLTLVIIFGVTFIPGFTRVVRGRVLEIKDSEFVKASIISGANNRYLISRIIIPNCLSVIFIGIAVVTAAVILAEAGLSFLGFGVQPPTPSWGLMLKTSTLYLGVTPLYSFAPGICIFLMVFGFSLLGDGIREVTSPKL